MRRTVVKEGLSVLVVLSGLVIIYMSISELRGHDYVAAVLLVVAGMTTLRAGVELMRPFVGE